MKKSGLSKTNSNLTKQSRATVTKQSTNATRYGNAGRFGPHGSGSFNLGTSASSVSVSMPNRQQAASRQDGGRNSMRLTTMGFGSSSKLGHTPIKNGALY